jgi:hypothetical protein
MDIEVVAINEAESPDAFIVALDVIYSGETWCRSLVWVDALVAAQLDREEHAVVAVARNALLDLLAVEAAPVSFHVRVGSEGATVLARATPGGAARGE